MKQIRIFSFPPSISRKIALRLKRKKCTSLSLPILQVLALFIKILIMKLFSKSVSNYSGRYNSVIVETGILNGLIRQSARMSYPKCCRTKKSTIFLACTTFLEKITFPKILTECNYSILSITIFAPELFCCHQIPKN